MFYTDIYRDIYLIKETKVFIYFTSDGSFFKCFVSLLLYCRTKGDFINTEPLDVQFYKGAINASIELYFQLMKFEC